MSSAQGRAIMVIGSTGMLGTGLVHYFRGQGRDVREISRREFVIGRDPASKLDLEGVGAVLNAAGMVNRRLAGGRNETEAYLVNSLFPHHLADLCEPRGVPFIHVSTDCVFDGRQGPTTEASTPNATDLYGRSKWFGEPRNALVLRTSIIGPERNNFYMLLSWFLAQTGECRGFTNHLWNGITTLELARGIGTILSEEGLYTHGVRHVYGEDTTKYDLLCAIAKVFRHPVRIVPCEDAASRDTRLRTIHPAFLDRLQVRGLDRQIAELLPLYESLRRG